MRTTCFPELRKGREGQKVKHRTIPAHNVDLFTPEIVIDSMIQTLKRNLLNDYTDHENYKINEEIVLLGPKGH